MWKLEGLFHICFPSKRWECLMNTSCDLDPYKKKKVHGTMMNNEWCSTCKHWSILQDLPIPIQKLIQQTEQTIRDAKKIVEFRERRETRQKHARPCVFELKALIFDWSNDANRLYEYFRTSSQQQSHQYCQALHVLKELAINWINNISGNGEASLYTKALLQSVMRWGDLEKESV